MKKDGISLRNGDGDACDSAGNKQGAIGFNQCERMCVDREADRGE